MQITKRHLDFLAEAKRAFEQTQKFLTYCNDDESLIALRIGESDDCIEMFELGPRVALFAQVIDKVGDADGR